MKLSCANLRVLVCSYMTLASNSHQISYLYAQLFPVGRNTLVHSKSFFYLEIIGVANRDACTLLSLQLLIDLCRSVRELVGLFIG